MLRFKSFPHNFTELAFRGIILAIFPGQLFLSVLNPPECLGTAPKYLTCEVPERGGGVAVLGFSRGLGHNG